MSTASTPTSEATATHAALRGHFVWYDLMTTDVAAATSFYRKIAGWGTQDFDMGPAGNYQMWTVDNVPVGGAVTLSPETAPPGTPPHWMAYVAVPSVDDTAAQAQSLGGQVLVPGTDIPTVGRFAIIADPQGAVIALYTSSSPTPPRDGPPKAGEFSWHELLTTDHNAAFAFYSQLFGWEKTGEFDMGPMGVYLMYGKGDIPYGGMFTKTPDMHMPSSWLYYIHVSSADTAAETATANGGRLMNGPMDVPGGDRIAQIMDPQGAAFAVHAKKPA